MLLQFKLPRYLSLPTMYKRVATTHLLVFEVLSGGCFAEVYLVADIRGCIRGCIHGQRRSCGIRALSLCIHRAWRRVERIVSMNELPDDAGPSGRARCLRPSEQILKKSSVAAMSGPHRTACSDIVCLSISV
jgi:hypothetical protein